MTGGDLKISYYLPDVTCPFSFRLNSCYGSGLVEETLLDYEPIRRLPLL